MHTEPLKTAALSIGVALAVFSVGLVGVGAVSVDVGDALFEDDEPDVHLVAHDGPGGQYVVEAGDGRLELDFSDPGLTRNAELEFHRVFDLVNEDEESVILWVTHDNEDVLRLYDDETGRSIAGEANAIALAPGERVVVSVDVDSRGVTVDELVTAVTFTAEFDVPFFEVDIVDIDDAVVAGQSIDVEAIVENVGNRGTEREVRFVLDGTVVDTVDVALDPDEQETVTVGYQTTLEDIGNRSVVVETDDASDEREVVVEPPDEPFFDVRIDEIPDSIDVGDRLSVQTTVENVGQDSDTQSIELVVDGAVVADRSVELDGGESESVVLRWTPQEGDEGTYVPVAVRSENDEETATIDVNAVFRAQASASSYAVTVGTEIKLRAERSITPPGVSATYEWSLDGDDIGSGEILTTTLNEPGEREVVLTMTGDGQTDTDTVTIDVEDETPPSIDLVVDEAVDVGESITFDASGSTDNVEIASFEWDPGDGTVVDEEGPTYTHTYDEPGRYIATVTVVDTSDNDATARVEVLVRGPQGSLSADAIDFGEIGTGSTSSDTVVVNNTGTTALELSNLEVEGDDAFELVGEAADGELTVEPGDTRSLEIAFLPTTDGAKSATVTFDTNNPDELGPIELGGTGLAGDLLPVDSSVEFGAVDVGQRETQRVTVENVGEGVVDITDTAVTGPDASVFEIVDGGGDVTLGSNESHDVTVAFEPTEAGDRTANLRIDAEGSTGSVALRGTGDAPRIRLDRESIEFPTVGLGNRTETSVAIRNSGNQPLEIDDVAVEAAGSESDHFWVDTESVPTSVSAGHTETVDIWFEPQADGDHEATLTIASNDPATPTVTRSMSGPAVGAEISIDQRTIDFGVVSPGDSVYMNVTIRNKQNSPADLHITTTDIVGGDEDAFAVNRGGAPIELSPGEAHDIEIEFSPLEFGNKNSQLQILSDAGNRPVINVWLSNTRAHIIVQEISNPTVNVEGRNLVQHDEYDVNVWTPTVDAESVGFRQLQFTAAEEEKFETNVDHNELQDGVPRIETDTESALQYVQLDHLDTADPDETFTGTGLRYQVHKSAIPAGAGPEDVTLYRWNDAGEWTNLGGETVLVEETDTHYVFVTETPGFSQFAVTVPDDDDSDDGPPGAPGTAPGPTTPSEDPLTEDDPPDDDDAIHTTVDFADDGNISTFQTRAVSRTEITELDEALVDRPPRALIQPRDDRGRSLEEDRTLSIGGQLTTLSAEQTRIMLAGEPTELTGERSTVGSSDAIADRDRLLGAVEITVPETRQDQPATVQLRIDRDRFGDSDPAAATIGHRTDAGWELLSTDVVAATDEAVVLAAETPGFSIFGIFADPAVQYRWSLPDGTTAERPVLNHTFVEPGLYAVELSITDAFGRDATTSYQILANDVPEASIEVVDREGEEVTLLAAVDNEIGAIEEITWTFPDGTELTGSEVTHTLEDGEHVLGLRVVDEFGAEYESEEAVAVGTLSQLIADALGVDLEVLVQLGLVSIVAGVITAGYRQVPWGAAARIGRRGPEITIFETPIADVEAGQFVVESISVTDAHCDLDTITIEVTDGDSTVVRKRIDVSGRTSYSANPETLVVPPGVEIDPNETYSIHVEVLDTHGRRTSTSASVTNR